MFSNPTILELNEKFRPVWALASSGSLLDWDLEVNMPEAASTSRGVTMSQLTLLRQKHFSELYPLLEKAERITDLNDYENGLVRVLQRSRKYFTKIPPSLLEEEQRTSVEATVVWRQARSKSDFKLFKPYFEKVVALKIQIAEKLGFEKHPYNALLDLGEEGITVDDLDLTFSRLIPGLKKILRKVMAESRFPPNHPLEDVKYDVESMDRVNRKVIELLEMPKDRFRMDVSTHPFTSNTSRDDVRITTRYEGVDFRNTMYSTIHESGHAIYELQIDEAMDYTQLANGASMGFHESQSRFWENIIGRSREFAILIRPALKENLSFVSPYDEEELYKYFNLVRPGLIRVDADELTYNFHIALRYELEKKLIGGKLAVSELPSIWNDMMDEYFGIRPKNDAEGVLQDIHWTASFGYFPSYSLGNVISGMIWNKMRKDLNLAELTLKGEFGPIKEWLYDKIHHWGSTYAPKDLSRRSLGEGYNPDYLLEYLEQKFSG